MTEIRVLKEVIVTITDIKTGVLGEFSREPVDLQSLKGLGDDGQQYEKHWDYWPEAQLRDFIDQWSWHDADDGHWMPYEAVYVYDNVSRSTKREGLNLPLVDGAGNLILPKGDIEYCEVHDVYNHKDTECLKCLLARRKSA